MFAIEKYIELMSPGEILMSYILSMIKGRTPPVSRDLGSGVFGFAPVTIDILCSQVGILLVTSLSICSQLFNCSHYDSASVLMILCEPKPFPFPHCTGLTVLIIQQLFFCVEKWSYIKTFLPRNKISFPKAKGKQQSYWGTS